MSVSKVTGAIDGTARIRSFKNVLILNRNGISKAKEIKRISFKIGKAIPLPSSKYKLVPVFDTDFDKVPSLRHDLEKVLFDPGYHYLQHPVTKEYKFSPFLHEITQPEDFAYDRIPKFIPPSQDKTMHEHAVELRKKYVSSTSSMSGIMSHIHFLLSRFKSPDISDLSSAFKNMPTKYTRGARVPCTIKLINNDGVYVVESDKFLEKNSNILAKLGKSMEKQLVLDGDEYESLIKSFLTTKSPDTLESYLYSSAGKFLLRSQLDCQDPRLPNMTFDLKTRAVVSVRMDVDNYKEASGYHILQEKGLYFSFEREFYDLVRSGFLKYSFQTRIGNMDGIFVAYHNTARMFGFQYIPVQELDRILYGNTITGEAYFRHNLALLGTLFDYITDTYPEKSFKVSVETRKDGLSMDVWVEVLNYFDDQPTVDGFKLLSSDEEFKAPSTSKIEYYSISLENNVNGETVDSAVLLDPSEPSTNKCWMVLASFTPHTELSQKILIDKYNKFRNFQRTYFKKDSVDDGARNENSFASFLRNLSKASAHSNAIDQEYADRYYKRC